VALNATLTNLTLRSNRRVGAAGAVALGVALSQRPATDVSFTLDLSNCNLGFIGVEALMDLVRSPGPTIHVAAARHRRELHHAHGCHSHTGLGRAVRRPHAAEHQRARRTHETKEGRHLTIHRLRADGQAHQAHAEERALVRETHQNLCASVRSRGRGGSTGVVVMRLNFGCSCSNPLQHLGFGGLVRSRIQQQQE
jgi:hypothetical protein